MKKFILLVAAVFTISIFYVSCKEKKHEESKSELHEEVEHHDAMATNVNFQCPMDCEKGKTYDEKGSCPVCKMDLKEKEKKEKESAEHEDEHEESHSEKEGEEHGEEEGEHQ